MYSFLVLLAGILQSAMMSFNGLLAESVSLWGVSFIVHFSGGLLLVLYIHMEVREKITLR